MPEPDVRLGVNFDANKLYYAVSHQSSPGVLKRIGSIDFSFNLVQSISTRDPDTFPGVCDTMQKLITEYEITDLRLILPPYYECWSIIPKSVFDNKDEREAHLNILMQGTEAQHNDSQWHELSNRDFKLLSVRRKKHLDSFASLINGVPNEFLFSDFQIGHYWMKHSQFRGSFLTISTYNEIISISSFLLGKLRAATFITYEDILDLPYLWLQHSSHLPWIEGLHEHVIVYGNHSEKVLEALSAYLDDSSEIIVMNTLKKMGLKSDEDSFNFPLERAFPAALLSVT
ncbi:MAG: hypothetical protein WD097_05260 [Balneolales bacterium]